MMPTVWMIIYTDGPIKTFLSPSLLWGNLACLGFFLSDSGVYMYFLLFKFFKKSMRKKAVKNGYLYVCMLLQIWKDIKVVFASWIETYT